MIDAASKEVLIGTLALGTPKEFWESVQLRFSQLYVDAFASIDADVSIISQHKLYALQQMRYVKADSLLFSLAQKCGLPTSMTAVEKNTSHYCYVAAPNVGLTQSYVQTTEALPNPAAYRDSLAYSSENPRLDLGDEPSGIFNPKDIYGVITHNPIGKEFDLEKQKLGTVQICIPTPDFKAWAAQIYLPEILAVYEPVVAQVENAAERRRKTPVMRRDSTGEAK